jgi:hypothetical protein
MKVFFWLLFEKDLNCACPFQGGNQDSINKFSKRIILSWLAQSYGYFETRWAPPIWGYRNSITYLRCHFFCFNPNKGHR